MFTYPCSNSGHPPRNQGKSASVPPRGRDPGQAEAMPQAAPGTSPSPGTTTRYPGGGKAKAGALPHPRKPGAPHLGPAGLQFTPPRSLLFLCRVHVASKPGARRQQPSRARPSLLQLSHRMGHRSFSHGRPSTFSPPASALPPTARRWQPALANKGAGADPPSRGREEALRELARITLPRNPDSQCRKEALV